MKLKGAICAAVITLAVSACNDFLKGGDLTKDPNNPLEASSQQLFAAVQSNMWLYQTSDLARLTSMWTQQATGAARQMQGEYLYTGVVEGTFDGQFGQAYAGGGLLDLRKIEAQSGQVGDSLFVGIAKVMEAWFIGSTADIWGDIPYNQADSFFVYPTPVLDPQQQVYDSVQAKLTEAIAEMGTGLGKGPGGFDLVYGGKAALWTELAHTLKARFYLHTAEVVGAQAYTNALAEAQLGISSDNHSYVANFSGSQAAESNPWWQFADANGGTGRAGDIIGVPSHLDSLLRNNDPRDTVYFATIDTTYIKRPVGHPPVIDPTFHAGDSTVVDTANASGSFFNADRLSPTFSQPFVTYNENLLIEAESQFQLGQTGPALITLNLERAAWATPGTNAISGQGWHPVVILAPEGSVSLSAIMTEKYITLFQNIEVWNDYKRTCLPALTPIAGGVDGVIPGRFLYPLGERQTNPNVPPPSAQPLRNWNDPNPCTGT